MNKLHELEMRMGAMESRVGLLETEVRGVRSEVRTNTALTEEIHGNNAEMYSAFTTGKNAVAVVTAIGNGVMWAADKSTRISKPLLILAIVSGSTWAGLKVPEWMTKLLSLL